MKDVIIGAQGQRKKARKISMGSGSGGRGSFLYRTIRDSFNKKVVSLKTSGTSKTSTYSSTAPSEIVRRPAWP